MVVAVVGYTNAGKSSLVSAFCGADVGVQDRSASFSLVASRMLISADLATTFILCLGRRSVES